MASDMQLLVFCLAIFSGAALRASAQLSPDYYDEVCPQALPAIRVVVEEAILQEPRMGASLVRMHFHDCFVNGCDASILLDDTPMFTGEKTAGPNNNSVRGFDVIDQIKLIVNTVCLENVVSCADILAVAARDSIVALGGASYDVLLGRRDSTTASKDDANSDIPSPFLDFSGLLSNFKSHGLTLEDLVVLSGAHTIGFARCTLFRSRIYNDTDIDSTFASALQLECPPSGGDDDNLASLDYSSPTSFDTGYYSGLLSQKGLLHSDQELFQGDGSYTDGLVRYYSEEPASVFWADFGEGMIKLGNISPLTGTDGVIRENCRVVAEV